MCVRRQKRGCNGSRPVELLLTYCGCCTNYLLYQCTVLIAVQNVSFCFLPLCAYLYSSITVRRTTRCRDSGIEQQRQSLVIFCFFPLYCIPHAISKLLPHRDRPPVGANPIHRFEPPRTESTTLSTEIEIMPPRLFCQLIGKRTAPS